MTGWAIEAHLPRQNTNAAPAPPGGPTLHRS